MIKAERNNVKVNGTQTELMSDLTKIIRAILEEEVVNEELLDIIVGLGKAEANGTGNDFMKKVLKEKVLDRLKEMVEEVEEKEEEKVAEEDNDEEEIKNLFKDVEKEIGKMIEKLTKEE